LAGHAELFNLGSDAGKLCFALVRLERATEVIYWVVQPGSRHLGHLQGSMENNWQVGFALGGLFQDGSKEDW
jgi:hypothetical protein